MKNTVFEQLTNMSLNDWRAEEDAQMNISHPMLDDIVAIDWLQAKDQNNDEMAAKHSRRPGSRPGKRTHRKKSRNKQALSDERPKSVQATKRTEENSTPSAKFAKADFSCENKQETQPPKPQTPSHRPQTANKVSIKRSSSVRGSAMAALIRPESSNFSNKSGIVHSKVFQFPITPSRGSRNERSRESRFGEQTPEIKSSVSIRNKSTNTFVHTPRGGGFSSFAFSTYMNPTFHTEEPNGQKIGSDSPASFRNHILELSIPDESRPLTNRSAAGSAGSMTRRVAKSKSTQNSMNLPDGDNLKSLLSRTPYKVSPFNMHEYTPSSTLKKNLNIKQINSLDIQEAHLLSSNFTEESQKQLSIERRLPELSGGAHNQGSQAQRNYVTRESIRSSRKALTYQSPSPTKLSLETQRITILRPETAAEKASGKTLDVFLPKGSMHFHYGIFAPSALHKIVIPTKRTLLVEGMSLFK